ncbi:MAG: endonuclease/exonuclease/phosphatase family protein [Flavobacteriales bacterium]
MSFNVRLFDVYKWSKNAEAKAEIFKLIQSYNPDILCLQEIYYERKPGYITLKELKQKTGLNHLHVENSSELHGNFCFGIATLSRFPILSKSVIEFGNHTDNLAIYTDIKFADVTVRVFNMHLESIRFRNEDYETMKNLTGVEDKVNLDGERKIAGRMKRAYKERARQAVLVRNTIQKTHHSVLVAGDFNDTPGSYAYHQVKGDLSDAFVAKGKNSGSTYVSKLPFMRIDYIMYDKSFDCTGFERVNKVLSDHYPIVADFKHQAKD